MSLQRICQHDVDVAELGESVHAIAERMRQRTVGCLVIVNEFREPIGIVTDRDLVIRVLAEGKDPYQVGHAQRVADYATKLAREVGVTGWDLTWLRIGAFIHDLGNMAVPEEVLRKADDLNEQERELMKVHTIMGDSMAKQLDFPAEVRPVVRSHHEQWAGTGYPDRLVGEEIPLNARIVSLADVYDALTSPRSFRSAYARDEALAVMHRDAEKMFDPRLFGVFEDMMKKGGFDG